MKGNELIFIVTFQKEERGQLRYLFQEQKPQKVQNAVPSLLPVESIQEGRVTM